jgi:hypothetical protein
MPSRRGAELSTGTTLPFTFYISREGGSLALIRFGSGSERKIQADFVCRYPEQRHYDLRILLLAGSLAATLGHFKSIIVVQCALF